ncbi:MAG: glycosyltransferase family 2 protein [Massilia sp.]
MATVDILLPVKNGAPYLAEAIDSVRAQTFGDWRLLVLDHGSTDGSLALSHRYAETDRRIVLHRLPNAVGLSGLLNAGLALSDCRYAMRLDADDACLSDRIAHTLAAFACHPGVAVVGGQADLIDARGASFGRLRLPVGRQRIGVASLFRNPFSHPALTMDRIELDRLGARYGADFLRVLPPAHSMRVDGLAEDYFMFGQLAILGKCVNLDQRLIRYRWHGGNISVTRVNEQMRLSLAISRFLARSLCAMHDLPMFDPAPFCNHGGRLFDMGRASRFDEAYGAMAASLLRLHGGAEEVQRELRFRRVLANRSLPRMMARYARFRRRDTVESGEWFAIKSWLLRGMPGRACTPATALTT